MKEAKQLTMVENLGRQLHAATGINAVLIDCDKKQLFSLGKWQSAFFNYLEYNDSVDELLKEDTLDQPIMFSDKLDLTWVAEWIRLSESERYLWMMGPVFLNPITIGQIDTELQFMHQSMTNIEVANMMIESLPIMDQRSLNQFAIMMHYAITEKTTQPRNFKYRNLFKKHAVKKVEVTDEQIDVEDAEQRHRFEHIILDAVRQGNLNYPQILDKYGNFSHGMVVAVGKPLRDAKDTLLIYNALCSRAAMEGGMPAVMAQKLEGQYMIMIENALNMSMLTTIGSRLMKEYVTRVHHYHQESKVSSAVLKCCDYIQTHIGEPLDIEELAKQAGYTKYYFTKKFYHDTGMRLNDYLNQARVHRAQLLLTTSNQSIQKISEDLCFGTRNYFSKVFRQVVGMTPVEYREKYRELDS